MGEHVEFENGKYVSGKRPKGFLVEAKESVAEETNASQGTTYSHKKAYHRDAGLSINHKISIDEITTRVIHMLNDVRIHAKTKLDVQVKVKYYRKNFMDPICPKKSNARSGGKLAIGILQTNLIMAYVNGHVNQEGTICKSASELIKCLNSSPDNLRNGDAIINSAIQENADLHFGLVPGGSLQLTPRSKTMGESEYRNTTGFCMTPSGDHFLSSDFSNPQEVGNMTPHTGLIFKGMDNHLMKKSKFQQ